MLSNFRVFCKTENIYHTVWAKVPPTKCPVNENHEIDTETITVLETIKKNNVIINNVDEGTRGYFLVETKTFDVPAQAKSEFTFSYPYAVAVYRAFLRTGEEHNGDSLSIVIAPDTPIGILTQNVEAESMSIQVSDTVLQNIIPGFCLSLTDGTNYNDLGFVGDIDYVNKQISVQKATTSSFTVGAYVLLNIHIVKDLQLPYPEKYSMGGGVVSGKPIPPNTTTMIRYKNHSGLSKKLHITFEYTY
jgi:hypothetical protein